MISENLTAPLPANLSAKKRREAANAGKQSLFIVPCELDEANFFVSQFHRHHTPVVGHKFSLAVADDSQVIRGVAIVSRPVGRCDDDGLTLEVSRVATDGCPNACSCLYKAAEKAAFALGYRRVISFILSTEKGVSIAAAGWSRIEGLRGAKSWNCKSRPRIDKAPAQMKIRWEVIA